MSRSAQGTRYCGLMAEFESAESILAAAKAVKEKGLRRYDAYTPYPIEELNHLVAGHGSKLPFLVFLGGLVGFLGGFGLQYWVSVIAYPVNIGGRPLNSWPAFIVPTFEMTILVAGITAALGMLALNGLPRPHHPVFNVERFALASNDRFFLYVEADDPGFDAQATRSFLEGLAPVEVMDVYDE